jgi:ligand-binding SRPBCC domain-containing protein
MRTYTFESEVWLPRSTAEVFSFFADAGNLQVLTPPWIGFQILTPGPIEMKPGTLIDYKLRIHGVPIRWQSEITRWEPPHGFVDEQRRGPYRSWLHEHRFVERDGGTLATDQVRYAVPGGVLVDRLFVARDLARIFEFRREKLKEIFTRL